MICVFNYSVDDNTTVRFFAMSYNDVDLLQSNDTLDVEGVAAYLASGILSISVTINGEKMSVPIEYQQQLIEVSKKEMAEYLSRFKR